jgi:hypothetical protein
MTWKDILKAHCGTEKLETEKKLVGNQKRIDADKDGKITGKDFAMLREKKTKLKKTHKSDSQIEKEILAEIEKEGGALGMKNLKPICPSEDLQRVLGKMKKEGKVFMHKDGDIYTHEPKR